MDDWTMAHSWGVWDGLAEQEANAGIVPVTLSTLFPGYKKIFRMIFKNSHI